jgi:nucleoside-diphosphate-sugar epimerase
VLDRVTIVRGDVLEPLDLVRTISRHDIDAVVHLAFLLGGGNPDPDTASPFLRMLTEGTTNAFEAARVCGLKRVVFASSATVYGVPGEYGRDPETPLREIDPPRPRHTYAASKLWGEHVAEWFNAAHDMEIVSMRICHTFGSGPPGSLAAGLTSRKGVTFTIAPEQLEAGLPVTVPPDDKLFDWLYTADTAEAFWLAATVPRPEHAVFNLLGERRPASVWREQLQRLYPDGDISVSDGREYQTALPPMDPTRLHESLGFRPRFTLETALDDYVARLRS